MPVPEVPLRLSAGGLVRGAGGPAVHDETDDERDGEEDRRADDYQPRIHGGTADGQLRGREEGDDEREEHREESDAADQPHARIAARYAVAAYQVGLRVAQADARGVHHHIHQQIETHGQGAQQEERHAHVVHDDIERRQQGDDAALDDENVDLHAVLVGLLQEAGQHALLRRP